jgi:hypothetical protein
MKISQRFLELIFNEPLWQHLQLRCGKQPLIGSIKKNEIVEHRTSCKDVPTGLAGFMPHRTTSQIIDIHRF